MRRLFRTPERIARLMLAAALLAVPVVSARAAVLTSVSDKPSTLQAGQGANHSFAFTTPSGIAPGGTVTFAFGATGQFTVGTPATSVSINGAAKTVGGDCTSADFSQSVSAHTVTLTACAGETVAAASTAVVSMNGAAVTNPSSPGTYYVSIGGTFGDFASIALPIQSVTSAASVSATVSNTSGGGGCGSSCPPPPPPDTTPPSISGVTVSNITTTGATVSWTTDKDASSELDYGLTTSYGSKTSDASYVASHSFALSGLTEGATYHFQIIATDVSGNVGTSPDYSFTTLDKTPPVITNIQATNIGQTAATIAWTTDEPSTSAVDYGTDATYGSTQSDGTLVTSHAIALTKLAFGTTYHFRVRSSDASLNEATSSDATFTTVANPPPGNVTGLTVKPGDGQNALAWVNPTDADLAGVRVISCTGSAPTGPTDTASPCAVVFDAAGTSFTQTGLSNGTTYFYGVYAKDTAGQYATGALASGQPTGAPADVLNLTARGGDGRVDLSWNNPTNPAPSSIRVLACTGTYPSGPSDADHGCSVAFDALGSSFTQTGLPNGSPRYYGVYVENRLGQFSSGRLVSATPRAITNPPPGPVTNLTALSGDGRVQLTWDNPTDTDVASDRVLACAHGYPSAPDDTSCRVESDVLDTSFTQTGLSNGISVYYGVYVRNTIGQYSTGAFATGTPSAAVPTCGDGTCNGNETPLTCPIDCGAPPPVCGNGICETGETPQNCPADCGLVPSCGNGICETGETPQNCPADCIAVPPTTVPPARQLTLQDVEAYAQSHTLRLSPQAQTFDLLAGTDVSFVVHTAPLPVQPKRVQIAVGTQTYELSQKAPKNGAPSYVADVPVPSAAGSVATAVSLFYPDGTTQTLPLVSNVQSPGFVYELVHGRETPLSGAVVTLLQGATGPRAWDGTPYGEANPILTGANGTFGWYVPSGAYRIRVEKGGYDTVVTAAAVAAANVVNARVELRPTKPILTAIVPAVVTTVQQLQANPAVQKAADTTAPAIVAVAVANTASLAVGFNLLAYLQYITTAPVLLFSRRKRKGYGIVYNAITKVPVDLAIVRLYRVDAANPSAVGQLVASRVTDKGGRYFFLAQPGTYRLAAVKQGFSQPSEYLAGVKDDGLFLDVYHSEPITVSGGSASITANIPMDPSVGGQTPERVKWQRRWRRIQNAVALAGNTGAVAVVVLRPSVFTVVMAGGQLLVYALIRRLAAPHKPVNWGIVYDRRTGRPLANAIARIFEPKYNKLLDTAVTDSRGRFTFLLGPNEYYAVFEHPGFEPHVLRPIDYSKRTEPTELAAKIGLDAATVASPPSAALSVPPLSPAAPSVPPPAPSAAMAQGTPASASPIDLMLAPPEPPSRANVPSPPADSGSVGPKT